MLYNRKSDWSVADKALFVSLEIRWVKGVHTKAVAKNIQKQEEQ